MVEYSLFFFMSTVSLNYQNNKIPPQALDLERSILGSIIIDKNALSLIIDILKIEAFYDTNHQYIYSAILDLFNGNYPIDLKTVVNQLRKNGKLEQVGGAYYIQQLTEGVISSANIEYYVLVITEYAIKRELISISNEIQRQSYDNTTDVFDLLDRAEEQLMSIASNKIRKNYSSINSILLEAIEDINYKRQNSKGITGIPSGFSDLDNLTAGWQTSDLIIIAARPGMGKTAFVLSLIRNAAIKYNIPVAIFSLEMSSLQLVARMISAEAELESEKIRKGTLLDYEWEQLVHKTKLLGQAPIFIDDTPALSLFELRTKCRRLKSQHDIKMVVIDYLQLLVPDSNKTNNREQEIALISRSLKSLAKELNIPIITPSQLSRAVETRGGDKRPVLSDLRESGAIEQDADIVMFLYRPEYYGLTEDESGNDTKGNTEIIIAKHRNGPLGTSIIKFIGKYIKFV